MSELNIGVLAVQGDVAENIRSTQIALENLEINGKVQAVKTPEQISELDGLIIPGGESTMIGQLSLINGSLKKIKEKIEAGMPVFGICAGLILLSKEAKDRIVGATDQPLLDLLDVQVERNSFGRQKESFEANVQMDPINIPKFNGVFIRAPTIIEVGDNVETISKFNDEIVAVKQDNILATAFHPELTPDVSLHMYFLNMTKTKEN
ncbi:MAG TPA: pyridoxal 5'-phosphate synthase glutaminase subunit PdxT [Nitrosopumilaceae archaeon]|nr:pyridoxal 5'-phosphate synthase glutaminase subunit PdxT [Nitrosopumilaceae archaeon]